MSGIQHLLSAPQVNEDNELNGGGPFTRAKGKCKAQN